MVARTRAGAGAPADDRNRAERRQYAIIVDESPMHAMCAKSTPASSGHQPLHHINRTAHRVFSRDVRHIHRVIEPEARDAASARCSRDLQLRRQPSPRAATVGDQSWSMLAGVARDRRVMPARQAQPPCQTRSADAGRGSARCRPGCDRQRHRLVTAARATRSVGRVGIGRCEAGANCQRHIYACSFAATHDGDDPCNPDRCAAPIASPPRATMALRVNRINPDRGNHRTRYISGCAQCT